MRLKLPSGRDALISRMTERDTARLRTALPDLTTEADARAWLVQRLATDRKGERLSGLSASDEAEVLGAILRMHERIYGVPLFGRPERATAPKTRSDAASAPRVLEFVDRYVASRECFSDAILLASQSGP
jgi:hypothetical protein